MAQSIHRFDLVREPDIKFHVSLRDYLLDFDGIAPAHMFTDMIRKQVDDMGGNKRVALATHEDSPYGLTWIVSAWLEDE